jgi:type I restriction enzyme, S subunit
MSEQHIVPKGWRLATLESVADPRPNSFVDGPFGSDLKTSDYTEAGIRVLQLQNLGDGVFIDKNKIYTSEAKARALARCRTLPGDIIIAKMADPLARAAVVPKLEREYVIVADLMRLRLAPQYDANIIVPLINSTDFRKEAERLSTGTTRTRISLSAVKKIKFLCPSIPEQRAIARILTTVDDLIAQTEALIAKYQAVKQGLLHDLLTRGLDAHGRLRPPHAEAPQLYKESPLGWIPKEWHSGTLKDYVAFLKSGLSRRIVDQDIGIPVLTSSNIQYNEFDATHLKYWYIQDPQGAKTENYVLDDGDILLCFINSVDQIGKVCVFTDIGRPCIYTTNLFRIKSGLNVNQKFLYLLLSSSQVQKSIKLITKPAINQASFTTGDFLRLDVPVIPYDEQLLITQQFNYMGQRIDAELELLYKYQTVKNGLMQDLLTGRVRVTVNETL